jgi:hypothetical protein
MIGARESKLENVRLLKLLPDYGADVNIKSREGYLVVYCYFTLNKEIYDLLRVAKEKQ